MDEGLLLKRTEEFMVNTEEEAKALIENAKAKQLEDGYGYELTSYSSTKKCKKDESWVIVKLVKVY